MFASLRHHCHYRPQNAFVVLLCCAVLAACGQNDEHRYLGYVEAEWVYVAAPSPGWIVTQHVDQGDAVSSGDPLFQLETTEQDAAVAEALAQLAQATAEARDLATGAREPEIEERVARLDEARARLELASVEKQRAIDLVERGVAAKSRADDVEAEYDTALAAVEAAEQQLAVANLPGRPDQRAAAEAAEAAARARLEAAQYRLAQRSVRADVDGRVEEVFHYVGEYVTAGAPLLAVLPNDGLKVRFFVPQDELARISLGDEIRINADGLSDPIPGTISFIAGAAEFTPPVIYSRDARAKFVFMVEANTRRDTGLHPGLPVEVNW